MKLKARKSAVSGTVRIPGSKSHTIRALFIAGLAEGVSEISNPLVSSDALSAVEALRSFGAEIRQEDRRFIVKGFGPRPSTPENVINVGNSGTTLRFAAAAAALSEGYSVFTGDYQIRRRPMGPLLLALNRLGAQAFSTRGTDTAPVVVKGRATGGRTSLDSVTSQYLSALLINAPLFDGSTDIEVTRLNEVPYVEMTLWWLERQGIKYERDGLKRFHIDGGQGYRPVNTAIPGDFSSATFFAVLAAVSGGCITMRNLDMNDPQGDKRLIYILEQMGAEIELEGDAVTVKGRALKGCEIDMNSIPDALPAMAVAGCFAEGETRLVNVPQARLKETDRISVMCGELRKMGADITELPHGLVIRQSGLEGCRVNGHDDHRVVMALAVAGLNAAGETVVDTAEAMKVTFPEFADLIKACGGELEII